MINQTYAQTYAKFRSEGTPSTPSWSTIIAKTAAIKIDKYYLNNYKNSPKIHLDMACGTGELCNYLQQKKISCFGVDKDEFAIFEAKLKNSGAVFECADFFDFQTDNKVTSVSAIHDVVNSIYQQEKLELFFNKCYNLISEGGFFVFDLITPLGFQFWNDTQIQDHSDFFMVQKTFYEEITEIGLVKISGFIKKNSEKYNRFEVIDKVRNYDINWICEKLKIVGFNSIKLYNSWAEFCIDQDLLLDKDSRIFVIATK